MGIFGFIGAASAPFITITIQLSIAFVVLVWFSLSLIYALSEIINFLLGQPFVGWLITGNINATNDLDSLLNQNLFIFNSPILIFLYIAIIMSIFLFLIYFVYSLSPFSTNEFDSSIKPRIYGIVLIILSVVWIPFLYSILVIATSALIMGLNGLLGISQNNTINDVYNFSQLKTSLINNLNQLNEWLDGVDLNTVSTNSPEFEAFLDSLNSQEQSALLLFVDEWNVNWASGLINSSKIDEWIKVIDNINEENLLLLNDEQIKTLNEIAQMSNSISNMSNYLSIFSNKINSIYDFNSFFILGNSNITFDPNSEIFTFSLDRINSLDNPDKLTSMKDFCFLLLYNQNFVSINYSQNLVNMLYSIALGKDSIFVPGWSTSIGTSWNLFWMIPYETKTPFINVSVFLFYNIKMLAIGSIINGVVLIGILSFLMILISRIVYIAFWPVFILFKMAKSGEGNLEIAKSSINELFYKFVNILAFAFAWNLVCVLTISFHNVIDQITYFDTQIWIKDILNILMMAGIIYSSFEIIKNFLRTLEESRSPFVDGANQIKSAQNAGVARGKRMSRNTQRSVSKSRNDIFKKSQQFKSTPYAKAAKSTKGGIFKKHNAGMTAKRMASNSKGSK